MKPFRISEYLKKYQSIIITLSLISGILCFVIVQVYVQKYQARAIISYNYEGASSGIAPDQTVLDVTEIYSSNIISEVMDNLNIDKSTLNMDQIRGAITVEPLYSAEELALETAKIESGESYKRKTDKYLITYSTDIFSGKEFSRKVLNEILDVYSKWFAENHINNTSGAKDINGILDKNYDYFEMMQTVEDSIESNVGVLYQKINFDSSFRSYKTGYTFLDIVNELMIIKDNEIPEISARILNESITKNKQVLIAKYQAKNTALDTENKAITEELSYLETAKNTYVNLMDDSGNTSITSDYILKDITTDYNGTNTNENSNSSEYYVEYDRIMQSYVDNRYNFEKNLIDKNYNSYLIGRFESSKVPDISEESEKAIQTEATIMSVVDRVDRLYTVLYESNDEFNEYLGAKYVNNLSSTSVKEKVPVLWLTLGIIMVFGVLGCGICIVVGRVSDIVDYYAYTDHIDGLPNRSKLDRFLEEKGRKSLVDDYVCINFKLLNLHEINMSLGRGKGDELIRNFADVLTGIFEPSEKVFVSNNGPGYYCVFAEGYTEREVSEMLARFRRDLAVSESRKEYRTEYLQGYAIARTEKCYDIKDLMLLARRKLQASAAAANDEKKNNNNTASGENRFLSSITDNNGGNTKRRSDSALSMNSDTGRLNREADTKEVRSQRNRQSGENTFRQKIAAYDAQQSELKSLRYESEQKEQEIKPFIQNVPNMRDMDAQHKKTLLTKEYAGELQTDKGKPSDQGAADDDELMSLTQEIISTDGDNRTAEKRTAAKNESDLFDLNVDYLARYRNSRR